MRSCLQPWPVAVCVDAPFISLPNLSDVLLERQAANQLTVVNVLVSCIILLSLLAFTTLFFTFSFWTPGKQAHTVVLKNNSQEPQEKKTNIICLAFCLQPPAQLYLPAKSEPLPDFHLVWKETQ